MRSNPKIAVMAPIWNYYPVIIGSMMAQTHVNWELHLMHDGPISDDWSSAIHGTVKAADHPNIHLTESPVRRGRWGHDLRREWLESIRYDRKDIDLVVITNADNYHNPVFLQALSRPFIEVEGLQATYCSYMTHNYFGYQNTKCKLECAGIDIAALMFEKAAACEVGWQSDEHAADWHFINGVLQKYGAGGFATVEGNLVCHN